MKPFRLHWFPRLRSTNDHAAAMRKRGELYAPAVVLTGRQTAGRGRGGNVWFSSRGVLTVTFVLAADDNLPPHELPLIAGLAVRNAAAALAAAPGVELKWPNDVQFAGRKLAGLLCERVNKVDLVGVGLNVNLDPGRAPADLRDTVTSLLAISGKPQDPTAVLLAVASHLHKAVLRRHEQPFRAFLQEYERHHALVGKRVTIVGEPGSPQVGGRVEGIDADARLVLRDKHATHRIVAGHVVVR